MSENVVSLADVRLTLPSRAGQVNILRGIGFDIPAGQAVGIVGPSGSGKSTLMMVMGGLERPTSGRVSVVGEEFVALSEDALARVRGRKIGIVFQSFHLVPTMSALENVALPLEFSGEADAFGQARAALDEVGLGARTDHFPGQLSGGEQQRVALARAIVARPSLLLADEPTGNLDGRTGQAVMDLIFRLKARFGTTLVLVTHDMRLAARCDRVIALRDGVVERDGPAADFIAPEGVGR